ncbi:MAG: serine hydrolase [Bacteroidota bacterium]|nr:serine hydrolase [Bacteroidota bacterium]
MFSFVLLFFTKLLPAQYKNSYLIDSLVKNTSQDISSVISNPEKYKIQIIYTQINRDKNNVPKFTHHYYLYDSSNYFYCASLVKLPCSILALEKINSLKDKGIRKETTMFTDSTMLCQKRVTADTTSANKLPSVAHYIRRMLLISDNLAFGRIYEFLTPDYIHDRLKFYGLPNMRIVHRFDGGCKGIKNLTANPVRFLDNGGNLIFQQDQSISKKTYQFPISSALVGKGYIDAGGKKVNAPKDFSTYNYMSLWDIHRVLLKTVFHTDIAAKNRFAITNDDQAFLMKYLRMYPRESDFPKYDPKKFQDSYKKYFLYGDSKKPVTDTNIRIYNIVGQSYGFMVDCAYIVDLKSKTEFMLSAVIYANEKDIINTGKYEYNSIALPYLSRLGKVFMEYEQKRVKVNKPDLSNLE